VGQSRGVVCSPHRLATEAGAQVLREGGNAVDACVALNAVLQVVYPNMCHLGGDGFWMVWRAEEQRLLGLNGSGRSAAAASADALRREGYSEMPQSGPYTITVPGCVDAWVEVLQRCGTWDLGRCLQAAERLARDGFEISEHAAGWMRAFNAGGLADDGWHALFAPGGAPPAAGERLVQPQLAETYRRLAAGGRDEFYRGALADRLAARVQELGGWITAADLAAHHSDWVEPVHAPYRGVDVVEMPPNSQGTTAQLALQLVESEPAADAVEALDLRLRASALAYAERDLRLADPARMDDPPDVLARPETVARLRSRLREPVGAVRPDGDTCYFCAVDAEGNCCSAIQSLYRGFVAGCDPETGVLFQSRGAFFSLEPGHRNELAPGVRTLHTLMPAMAFREGSPWLVFGTMGGNAQAQIHVQLLTRAVDEGLAPAEAVAAPRWILGPSVLTDQAQGVSLEPGLSGMVEPLRSRGWDAHVLDDQHAYGHSHMIRLDGDGPIGAADPRADSLALSV